MITTCVFLDDEKKMCRNDWSFVVINHFKTVAFQDRAYIPRSLEQSSLYFNSEPSYKVPVLLTITPLSTSIFFFFPVLCTWNSE